MNDPDDFLSRWSRRKRRAGARAERDVRAGSDQMPVPGQEKKLDPTISGQESPAPSVPEFDVNKLPPIDSIGADTDISAFMQKGVPLALRHAALRRAWSADPAIRDFMGQTENYWDAAGPDGVFGFGDLDPSVDVKRMISELFGETIEEKASPEAPVSMVHSEPAPQTVEKVDGKVSASSQKLRDVENAATQKAPPESGVSKRIVRRHGGAIPE